MEGKCTRWRFHRFCDALECHIMLELVHLSILRWLVKYMDKIVTRIWFVIFFVSKENYLTYIYDRRCTRFVNQYKKHRKSQDIHGGNTSLVIYAPQTHFYDFTSTNIFVTTTKYFYIVTDAKGIIVRPVRVIFNVTGYVRVYRSVILIQFIIFCYACNSINIHICKKYPMIIFSS